MTEKETNLKVASARPVRKPVGIRNRLDTENKDPNFVYRYVNDVHDRVSMFEEGGYEIVDMSKHKLGKPRLNVGSPVDNSIAVGGGTNAVLMRIPKEFYEQDQKQKAAKVDDREQGLQNPAIDGAYGSIKIG